MAQTILIQKTAIKQLNARVEAPEALRQHNLSKLAQRTQTNGGLLAGLFGGSESRPPTYAARSADSRQSVLSDPRATRLRHHRANAGGTSTVDL
ncbi:DUF2076 domain-containing protein [Enterobacteriaceae bacterium 4M9]|nr:DUF2076 domain-containing protein [Enterobacteriaceae bacterium 4M9]